MPQTKEEKRVYDKKYYQENKEKIKEERKVYFQKNKEKIKEKRKKYYQENKEKEKKQMKKYIQTPKGKKTNRISQWKYKGIICDYEHYYNIYIQQTKCYYCKKEFKNTKDRHLDHDHSITDYYNVRGILCCSCNFKDVYKIV